ncbi:MAG: 50S ribosomal protein L5 [Legionellales bacterium]|nr:50S ribosomal protein L5 [Legionellales bacterium]OUX64321.1 MAG: 50S ribosomal protein L5 [Gammaproteobacteria bacterium TMED281]
MTKSVSLYQKKIVPEMIKQFGYKNPMEVPQIEKVTLNMGLGEAVNDKKIIDIAFNEMQLIAGQCPLKTFTKKSIAGFKIRDGWPIGVKVTLRRKRMHDFLFKLVNMVLPFIRDFRGLNAKAFDGRGNYNFGIKEHIVFPEIDFNTIEKMFGLNITVTTSAKTDEEAQMLLKLYGFPLR